MLNFEGLKFKEDTHQYFWNELEVPSVTQIITSTNHNALDDIPTNILENASERGTAIHQAIEFYNKYNFANINEDYKSYFEAYKKWKTDNQDSIKEILSEIQVFNKVMFYAGTADMLITDNEDKQILIDIKTTAELNEKYVSLQLSAYKDALISAGMKIDKMYVLWLKKDGTYVYKDVPDKTNIFKFAWLLYSYWKEQKC